MSGAPTTTTTPFPISDGFDLPFYNGYAIDVAVLLAAYALTCVSRLSLALVCPRAPVVVRQVIAQPLIVICNVVCALQDVLFDSVADMGVLRQDSQLAVI